MTPTTYAVRYLLPCILIGSTLPCPGAQQARDLRAKMPSSTAEPVSKALSGDYVLSPQDVIRVYVFQEEDINKQGEISISNDSTITLPMIGTISLKGKTVRQAEEFIRALYDKDFIVNPTVSVTVQKYSDRGVSVSGSVNEPKRVQFPQEKGLTIVEAIVLAGGHNRLADLRKVKLTRKNEEGQPEPRVVDVDAIMKGNARDVPLEVGDNIMIPERVL